MEASSVLVCRKLMPRPMPKAAAINIVVVERIMTMNFLHDLGTCVASSDWRPLSLSED